MLTKEGRYKGSVLDNFDAKDSPPSIGKIYNSALSAPFDLTE
jgi:hypothetical protein